MNKRLLTFAACLLVSPLALAAQPKPAATNGSSYNNLLHLGESVVSSPYIGVRSAYDASDLITNFPLINEDLKILQQRQHLPQATKSPRLEISGNVIGQIWAAQRNRTRYDSDIDLTGAELDILGSVSNWASAYLSLTYDNLPRAAYPLRVTNSRIQVSTAFVTIGNLNRYPYYGTIGQFYLPFGVYDNYMVTDTLVKSMFQLKQRAALLGYSQDGMYTSVYAFRGDLATVRKTNAINNGGANLGYKTGYGNLKIDLGGGYILNIADATGISNILRPAGVTRNLQHEVPAYDAHANLSYGPWTLLGEYIGTTRSFSTLDMTYKGKPARLSAIDGQLLYKFKVMNKPSKIVVGYSKSWDAAALSFFGPNPMILLPQQSYMATVGTSIWKGTVESLEYRYNIGYNRNTYATSTFNGATTNNTLANYRKHSNVITLQIAAYF